MANGNVGECADRIRAFLRRLTESGEFDDDTIAQAIEEVAPEIVGRGFSNRDPAPHEDNEDGGGPGQLPDDNNDGG